MSRVRVRGWWFWPLLVALVVVIPWPAWLIELAYARGVYPQIQRVVTQASNQAPFAIIDVGLGLLAVYLVVLMGRAVFAILSRGFVSAVWELIRRVVRAAAVIALAFLVLWGMNYRRQALETTLGGASSEAPDVEALRRLATTAATEAGRLRAAAAGASADYQDIAGRLEASFQRGLSALGLSRLATPGRPKESRVLTPFFTAAGVNGMVNPVALESIVHPDLLPFERPMVLAHEWAHLAGFADEADASAIAWLACVTGDAALAYSAHIFVILETAGALPPGDWRAVRARLAPGVVEDLAALAQRLTRQRPAVRQSAFRVYDGYLKSNRVQDGVRSYNRVLRVLLTPRMVAAAGR